MSTLMASRGRVTFTRLLLSNSLSPSVRAAFLLNSQFLYPGAQSARIDAENRRRSAVAVNHPVGLHQSADDVGGHCGRTGEDGELHLSRDQSRNRSRPAGDKEDLGFDTVRAQDPGILNHQRSAWEPLTMLWETSILSTAKIFAEKKSWLREEGGQLSFSCVLFTRN